MSHAKRKKDALKKSLPNEGERVQLRGREARGWLATVHLNKWALVRWDEDAKGPQIVHHNELERI